MIINIRGTSGSGKSHLVKRVMIHYPQREPFFREERRQPLYYHLDPGALSLLGHYEIECGGLDTIKTLDEAIDLALVEHNLGRAVLMEGLLASENVIKFAERFRGLPLHVIRLTTPLDQCLAAVRERRDKRGNTKPLNPTNTSNRVKVIERACFRLKQAGVKVEALDREAAYQRVCELLQCT